MTELVYKSSWCTAEPSVYENNLDEATERFIGKVFANKLNRLSFKNGRYFYEPSQEYREYFAKTKRLGNFG